MAGAVYADLRPRLMAAAVLAGLSAVFLYAGGYAFAGFIAAGILLMTQELLDVVRTRWNVPRPGALAMGAFGGAAVLLPEFGAIAVVAAMAAGLAVATAFAGRAPNLITVGYYSLLVLAGVAVVLLRWQPGGLWLVVWVVLCVIAADVGGYVFGRRFQGPKFWPAVSPKKTWSGVLGGLLLTALVALAYGAASGGNLLVFLAMGALIAIVSVAGDVLESALKRHYGVKDAGTILPGHGGLMDRFDGMTAVMVALLALIQITDVQALLGVDYTPPPRVAGSL